MPTPTPKKLGDLTVNDLVDYLRLTEPTTADNELLATILEASKQYIYKYTGLDPLVANNYYDLSIAVYVLSQDMFDNRAYYVDTANVNKVVEAILGLHSVNLL